jgi:cysteine desulfurase
MTMALSDGSIYLDHAATTPVDPRVLEAMLPYFSQQFGNPGGIYSIGRRAAAAVDDARESVAAILNCRPTEVIFTSGGSEADNLAIVGIARASRKPGKHIITSAIEHHAVLHTCQALEKEGYRITYLPVDDEGRLHVEDVAAAITDETILVTIMLANNEVGTIQPIAAIGELCRQRRIPFHTDAVQGGGLLALDVRALNVDALSLSAHKFYGPRGVGILYLRTGVRVAPQIHGGSQERNRRAGTENVAGIVGAARALTLAQAERDAEVARLTVLRDHLIAGILRIEGSRLTGHATERLANNASFAFQGIEGESLLLNLDVAGIAASSGSACTSAIVDPSHVLVALGLDDTWNRGHLRLTLGHSTTMKDIEIVIDKLPGMIAALRGLGSRSTGITV